MKYWILIIVVFLFLALPCFAADSVDEVRQYAMDNQVSCTEEMTTCTLMYCGAAYYDSFGDYVIPDDCNACTTSFYCSDGKTFSVINVPGYFKE